MAISAHYNSLTECCTWWLNSPPARRFVQHQQQDTTRHHGNAKPFLSRRTLSEKRISKYCDKYDAELIHRCNLRSLANL